VIEEICTGLLGLVSVARFAEDICDPMSLSQPYQQVKDADAISGRRWIAGTGANEDNVH
jgi:hypothetical protein